MLPNAQLATIEPAKVRDYLLSPVHPIGRFKATVFTALGYTQENWSQLRDDLLVIAQTCEATAGLASPYGRKFEVSGTLRGPNGRSGYFLTAWIIPNGEVAPKFVTAHPS
jgi:hypothetical protein